MPWESFRRHFARQWRQGEHVSIIGPTGRGKSWLAYNLLTIREYPVIFATKPRDDTLASFAKIYHFREQNTFNPDLLRAQRYIVWPKFKKAGDERQQQTVFVDAFNRIFAQGGWTLYVDETYYFSDHLKLDYYLRLFWTQARSNKISFVAATQRPRDVPVLMYDQATHLFLFRFTDENGLKRLGGIQNHNSKAIQQEIATLGNHQFLYINCVTEERIISEVSNG